MIRTRWSFAFCTMIALAGCGGNDNNDPANAATNAAPNAAANATPNATPGEDMGGTDEDAADPANNAAGGCGADVWHCPGTPFCRENGPTPFGTAENLARSGCGDDATMGRCPAPGVQDGSCQWETGMVCYFDVYYGLDDTQRETASNTCLGTWTNP